MKRIVACIMVLAILLYLGSPVLAAKRDKVNPFITNTDPFDAQRNVLTDNRIILQFNETVLKGRSIAQIKIKESESTMIGYDYILRDNILQLSTKTKLKPGTTYHIFIPAAVVKDTSGNNMKEDFELDFVTESMESANGSEALSQGESKSTHRIDIDAVMEGDLSSDEEDYLIAAFKAIGVQINQINVNKAESSYVEEKPEETEEVDAESMEEEVEETEVNTIFDVYLVDCGNNKVEVIRVIRSLTGLDLAAAKLLADNSNIKPQLIKEGVSDADARVAGKKLEEAGAVVTIIDHEQNTDTD